MVALLILIMPTTPCGMKAYKVHRQPVYMEVIVVSLTSSTGGFTLDSLKYIVPQDGAITLATGFFSKQWQWDPAVRRLSTYKSHNKMLGIILSLGQAVVGGGALCAEE